MDSKLVVYLIGSAMAYMRLAEQHTLPVLEDLGLPCMPTKEDLQRHYSSLVSAENDIRAAEHEVHQLRTEIGRMIQKTEWTVVVHDPEKGTGA